MEREWVVEESTSVAAGPGDVYAAVADLRRMGEWSPEVFAIWVRGKTVAPGARFAGFNRIGWRVVHHLPGDRGRGKAFAFRVSSFGMRMPRCGDTASRTSRTTRPRLGRVSPSTGRTSAATTGARFVSILGRVFTGGRRSGARP